MNEEPLYRIQREAMEDEMNSFLSKWAHQFALGGAIANILLGYWILAGVFTLCLIVSLLVRWK